MPSSSRAAEVLTVCPFCEKSFRRIGSHLPHCHARGDAKYEHLLAKKTLKKCTEPWSMKKCENCGKWFKRLDAHLLRSSHCKSMAGQRDIASNGTPQPEAPGFSATPPLSTLPSPSLASPPDVRKVLLLPRAEEDWKRANEHFMITLMPLVMNETDVDTMNKMICDEVYEYFASRYSI